MNLVHLKNDRFIVTKFNILTTRNNVRTEEVNNLEIFLRDVDAEGYIVLAQLLKSTLCWIESKPCVSRFGRQRLIQERLETEVFLAEVVFAQRGEKGDFFITLSRTKPHEPGSNGAEIAKMLGQKSRRAELRLKVNLSLDAARELAKRLEEKYYEISHA